MRIAIDIDSTLHPYWLQLQDVAERRYGVALSYEDQHTWTIADLEPHQLRACIRETHSPDLVLAAEPYAGAVEAVASWRRDGHFIHITSHRARDAHPHTSEWLARIGLPYDELHCSYDKVTRCVELGVDLLIDDSPVNLERALEAGIAGATLRHPWNRELCERGEVVWSEDWPGLAGRLAPLLAGGRVIDPRHA